jgi:CheY-like chemotaxis protein
VNPLSTALVAEDNRTTRFLFGELLREHGVTVTEARDGRDALFLASRLRPDLLILDGLLPGYTAFEILTHLKASDPLYKPAVFIVTALFKSNRFEREARITHGVDEYLEKPIEPPALLAAVRRHFDLRP